MLRQALAVLPFVLLAACAAPVDQASTADGTDPAAAPATGGDAEKVDNVKQADSTTGQYVHFYNDGWYPAYADIYGYDANGKEIYHDWSGTQYHGGNRWFNVPAGVSKVYWMVRMDPFGNTIHQQFIANWYNFNDFCGGKHATMYVGGFPNSTNSYDMHCSNW